MSGWAQTPGFPPARNEAGAVSGSGAGDTRIPARAE